jgi:gamma-glutamyltranspeptidase
VVDVDGNAVSATSSINYRSSISVTQNVFWYRFGAMRRSDKLGFIWNNEMNDFSTPESKNYFGFAPSNVNYINAGKRPMSSMSPLIIYDQKTGQVDEH